MTGRKRESKKIDKVEEKDNKSSIVKEGRPLTRSRGPAPDPSPSIVFKRKRRDSSQNSTPKKRRDSTSSIASECSESSLSQDNPKSPGNRTPSDKESKKGSDVTMRRSSRRSSALVLKDEKKSLDKIEEEASSEYSTSFSLNNLHSETEINTDSVKNGTQSFKNTIGEKNHYRDEEILSEKTSSPTSNPKKRAEEKETSKDVDVYEDELKLQLETTGDNESLHDKEKTTTDECLNGSDKLLKSDEQHGISKNSTNDANNSHKYKDENRNINHSKREILSQIVPKSKFYEIEDRVKVKPIVIDPAKTFCKSGRFWKTSKDRFSSLVTTKGLKSDLKAKLSLKEELKRTKMLERSMKEATRLKKEEKRKRRLDNEKRREENARKSEVVQQLKNPAKIKKMKKKQLRMLAKRDLTKVEGMAVV